MALKPSSTTTTPDALKGSPATSRESFVDSLTDAFESVARKRRATKL